jgi:hypothetical protein
LSLCTDTGWIEQIRELAHLVPDHIALHLINAADAIMDNDHDALLRELLIAEAYAGGSIPLPGSETKQ